jgi:predicted nucleic-acid-binding Zn-ribbon protein
MKTGFTKRKCPKCGGNLYLDSDYCIEGSFISWYEEESCLQCGYSAEIPPHYNTFSRSIPLPVKSISLGIID